MIATTTQVKNKIKSRKNTALVYIKKQTNKKTNTKSEALAPPSSEEQQKKPNLGTCEVYHCKLQQLYCS